MLQRGTTLEHNKYYIEDVIGQGGFGHVYRARERLTGEVVAIKELTIGLDNREIVQRFVQEARATLRLTHPYIARTYGIFHDRGTYYLTMEYLPGGSLADRLRRGRLPMRDAVRIATNVCKALAYAHDKGVVHCDIKPANVLFDKDGEVRLADFGIAHVSEQMMTRKLFTATGMMMGTVRYMAPEQLEGVRDDPRVDIYAMGAMLYEMLAGRPYLDFETETTPAAQVRNIQRIQSESPRPLRAVNPATPAWLAETVARALRKRPEDRFATAEKLREALQSRYPEPKLERSLPLKRATDSHKRQTWPEFSCWQWGVLCVLGAFTIIALIGLSTLFLRMDSPTELTPSDLTVTMVGPATHTVLPTEMSDEELPPTLTVTWLSPTLTITPTLPSPIFTLTSSPPTPTVTPLPTLTPTSVPPTTTPLPPTATPLPEHASWSVGTVLHLYTRDCPNCSWGELAVYAKPKLDSEIIGHVRYGNDAEHSTAVTIVEEPVYEDNEFYRDDWWWKIRSSVDGLTGWVRQTTLLDSAQ